jgi:glycerol-3-phosphate acyltransferase PlsY
VTEAPAVAGLVLAAYLAGSLPTSYLVGRALGVDLRRYGSGNLGATNLYRAAGLGPAAFAALVDIAKGAAPTLLFPRWDGAPQPWALAYGLAAVAGHVWPVWLGFRGGKGVATGGGVFLVLAPAATLLALALWAALVRATRIVSIGSLAAATSLPVLAWATGRPRHVVAVSAAAAALVWWTHRANVRRLLRGEELRARRGETSAGPSGPRGPAAARPPGTEGGR